VDRSRQYDPQLVPGKLAPWRRLTVEVTPEAVQAFWHPDEKTREPLARRSPQQLAEDALDLRKLLRGPDEDVAVEFAPQGGFGLLVTFGAASFRNLILEPLAPP
jgi:hypothetical protein